ncbi:MAG: hypothetical protein ABGX16_05790 [Pirellulales bacterium]
MNTPANNTSEDLQRLRALGTGQRIAAVCATHNLTRAEFDTWWQQMLADRNGTQQS